MCLFGDMLLRGLSVCISGTSVTRLRSVYGSVQLCNKPAGQETSGALPSYTLGDCWEDQGPEPSFYGGHAIPNGLGLPSVLLWFLGLPSLNGDLAGFATGGFRGHADSELVSWTAENLHRASLVPPFLCTSSTLLSWHSFLLCFLLNPQGTPHSFHGSSSVGEVCQPI